MAAVQDTKAHCAGQLVPASILADVLADGSAEKVGVPRGSAHEFFKTRIVINMWSFFDVVQNCWQSLCNFAISAIPCRYTYGCMLYSAVQRTSMIFHNN